MMPESSNNTLGILLEQLGQVCSVPAWRVLFAADEGRIPSPPGAGELLHPFPRLILPLSGRKHVVFYEDGIQRDIELQPGEAIVVLSGTCIRVPWGKPQDMLSIVFSDSFIRILRIIHNGHGDPPPLSDRLACCYHTTTPPEPPIRSILDALAALPRNSAAIPDLFRALLAASREQLARELDGGSSHEEQQWRQIYNAMQRSFTYDISLEDVAADLHLTPVTLSRRLRARTGLGFREYLTWLRLNYAERLLTATTLSSEKIAAICGFNYPSYFIRVFRKRHNLPPNIYRQQKK